jgi:aconitate hydratase
MAKHPNSFGTRSILKTDDGPLICYSLNLLEQAGFSGIDRLPYSIRILLENLLRHEDSVLVTSSDIEKMALWGHAGESAGEVPFMPARVLLQDFTGVPAIVDLAAMRDAAQRLYGDCSKINPLIPAELVIDHSVQVDVYGSSDAVDRNTEFDYRRNSERYAFLRWGQKSFRNFSVVPPSTGICHQVNLEYLARGVCVTDSPMGLVAYPDTVVGLDSHTTMINGLGVLGWGVGGIEAEAVMLGRPYYLLTPQVIGFKLEGKPTRGTTSTDLVLTITQLLRKKGVVGKFVEFFGPGVLELSLEDRATIANMAPEYGATMGFFPVDEKTLRYLQLTGRPEKTCRLVEVYCKTQGLFRSDASQIPVYSDIVTLDMATIEPCLAGPKRPQDRVLLNQMKPGFEKLLLLEKHGSQANHLEMTASWEHEGGCVPTEEFDDARDPAGTPQQNKGIEITLDGTQAKIDHGAVVIAAITSCTNTSNPSALMAAGLLAKRAVEQGLKIKPWVKTSLAPGSKVALDYLASAGLLPFLERLNFYPVAFGCTTCIGNSGPLGDSISRAIKDNDLIVASVLSGNRNFEGRINPLTRINYLASPPLVVAYAIAGTVDIHFETESLGKTENGTPVYLKDIWPSLEEIQELVTAFNTPDRYRHVYSSVFDGDAKWQSLPTPEHSLYPWEATSTYIKEPPFFSHTTLEVEPVRDIQGARVLAVLDDSVTTDHISPAGGIPANSPAGKYLIAQNVLPPDFNSYGARRGNHEVMMRGTFANIRLKNRLVPGVDGGWTLWLPEGEKMTIYEAAMKYMEKQTPLIVLAGKEYGTGSSRDWAAKGTQLLGIRAVVAESFERIHRSNLVCMGVLPLQFKPGDSHESLGLTGSEIYEIAGIASDLFPGKELQVIAQDSAGGQIRFHVIARLDSPVEVAYYQHGGILNYVLRGMA